MKTIRDTILAALDEQGHNRAWLAGRAAQTGVCDAQTVYRYLRGDRDTSTGIAGGLMAILGIQVVPKARRARAGV